MLAEMDERGSSLIYPLIPSRFTKVHTKISNTFYTASLSIKELVRTTGGNHVEVRFCSGFNLSNTATIKSQSIQTNTVYFLTKDQSMEVCYLILVSFEAPSMNDINALFFAFHSVYA